MARSWCARACWRPRCWPPSRASRLEGGFGDARRVGIWAAGRHFFGHARGLQRARISKPPESAPILRQIASYLEANPTTRLKITGHTDNVGSPASNLDLSKRRSASVARVLGEQFVISADRFATDDKGDTQAVASNAKSEGRAMNRRVEFAKL